MLRCCIPLDRIHIRGIAEYHSFATIIGMDVMNVRRTPRYGYTDHLPFSGPADQAHLKDRFPRRSFSLKDKVPFIRSGRNSRDTSPSRGATTPPRRTSQLADITDRKGSTTPTPSSALHEVFSPANNTGLPSLSEANAPVVPFNVAVLNDLSWFAEALTLANKAARLRQYKPDATPPEVLLSLGGFDCLTNEGEPEFIADEETNSTPSGQNGSSDENLPEGMDDPKAQKAALAAKVFGIRPDEKIWRECSFNLQD